MIRIRLVLVFFVISTASFANTSVSDTDACRGRNKSGEYHCRGLKNAAPAVAVESVVALAADGARIRQDNTVLQLDYEGFTVWLDCSKHGAVKFRYNAHRDSGNAKRYDKFFLDPAVPAECQQTTAKAYGHDYDRGHLVPANHLDASPAAIKATNTMTNILPQAANMNRGAWLLTEEIIECYRDIDELLVIGGVIWRDNPGDDYFVRSHGVKTPVAFWKAVIRGRGQDERAIAWVVPNSAAATKKRLDDYLVTIADLERVTGEKIPVADYAKRGKPTHSWLIPKGCDKG